MIIQKVPAAVFCNMIMLCFREGGGWHGGVLGTLTQSALREGLLDLIQHIPKQRRLITFSINGHGLTRLEGKKERKHSSLLFLHERSGSKLGSLTVLTSRQTW